VLNFFEKVLDLSSKGKTYVIAELGSNFKTLDDLFASINIAKNCGANAIKFQYFTVNELYGPTYEISQNFPLAKLKEKADAAQIDFLCSAFSPEGVAEVDKYVSAHKIASSEMAHIRLLEAVKKTGKPLILSTGGYFLADIKRSLDFMAGHPTVPLHCNISYPTKFCDVEKFQALKKMWTGPVGYSDHTTSIDVIPLYFASAGAAVYEKHFNPFNYTDTPDSPHSINTAEFQAMVRCLNKVPSPFTEENEARLMHVRRIVAIKDILPGDVLSEGVNIGIFRSKKADANGVSPFAIAALEGKISLKTFQVGDGISMADAQ
jgi:N,N'-diacetyllegionaminate synthase